MPLATQTVADAIVARLSGATDAADRVYSDHPWPFAESELPAWRVEVFEEPSQGAMLSGDTNEYRPRIVVSGVVRATDAVDAELNALVADALPALFAAPIPYGLELDGEIERAHATEDAAAVGRVSLPLRALYFAALTAPETILS
jgi:hypothetical protein